MQWDPTFCNNTHFFLHISFGFVKINALNSFTNVISSFGFLCRLFGHSEGKYVGDSTLYQLQTTCQLTSRLDCKHTPVEVNHSCLECLYFLVYYNLSFLGVLDLRLALGGVNTSYPLPFSALFLSPLINILFKQPPDATRHQRVHKFSWADEHNSCIPWRNKNPHIRAHLQRPGYSWNMRSKQPYFSLIIKNTPKMDTLHILDYTQWWRHCEDIPSGWLLLCL